MLGGNGRRRSIRLCSKPETVGETGWKTLWVGSEGARASEQRSGGRGGLYSKERIRVRSHNVWRGCVVELWDKARDCCQPRTSSLMGMPAEASGNKHKPVPASMSEHRPASASISHHQPSSAISHPPYPIPHPPSLPNIRTKPSQITGRLELRNHSIPPPPPSAPYTSIYSAVLSTTALPTASPTCLLCLYRPLLSHPLSFCLNPLLCTVFGSLPANNPLTASASPSHPHLLVSSLLATAP